jgi:hypothetical protein
VQELSLIPSRHKRRGNGRYEPDLFASDHHGEAIAALRTALAEARSSIDRVAHLLEAATMVAPKSADQPKPPRKPDPRKPWQQTAAHLLARPEILGMRRPNRGQDEVLLHKEINFLGNVAKSKYAPSLQQEKWLRDIANRLDSGRAA